MKVFESFKGSAPKVLSGAVMIAFVFLCFWGGKNVFFGLASLIGFFLIDELELNFFKVKRASFNYIFSQLLYVGSLVLIFFLAQKNLFLIMKVPYLGLALNFLLFIYLFFQDIDSKVIVNWIGHKMLFLTTFFILIPLVSLVTLLFRSNWMELLIVILIINYGMDTFAWFFGKKFGKHKLMPHVSPNKTVEGLIGGMIGAGIAGSVYWSFCVDKFRPSFLAIFILLAFFAQIGDLVQSKIKRQFDLKDSSSLIPGHGGVYDRLDSLLFVAPLFAAMAPLLGRG